MATPETTTPETEVESQLLANILGLIKPEEKDVRPPEATKTETSKTEETQPKPEDKTAEAKTPPTDAKPAPAAETPPKPEPKKVGVRKREPVPAPEIPDSRIEDVVKRTIAAQTTTKLPPPEVAAPPADPELRPEQKEELELARFVESKDPSKKGLSDRMLKFYEAEKKFLEKRLADEGDEYDPSADPAYRKFLAANAPTFDRKAAVTQRITEEAEARAADRVRKEFSPELEKTRQELVELKERPKIQARVNTYLDEVASGMPEEVYAFYKETGGDLAKTQEAFPLEYSIIENTINGVLRVADEFLSIRSGLKPLDPKNEQHQFINNFVDDRAKAFLSKGGDALVRGGKRFVHPYQWKPGMEATNWTFDDEDVLRMLKVRAQTEAKQRISAEQKRIEHITAARQKRTVAPKGATPPVAEPESPKVGSPLAPGAANTTDVSENSLLSNILGFAPKSAK